MSPTSPNPSPTNPNVTTPTSPSPMNPNVTTPIPTSPNRRTPPQTILCLRICPLYRP
jgi:hypothetical protein